MVPSFMRSAYPTWVATTQRCTNSSNECCYRKGETCKKTTLPNWVSNPRETAGQCTNCTRTKNTFPWSVCMPYFRRDHIRLIENIIKRSRNNQIRQGPRESHPRAPCRKWSFIQPGTTKCVKESENSSSETLITNGRSVKRPAGNLCHVLQQVEGHGWLSINPSHRNHWGPHLIAPQLAVFCHMVNPWVFGFSFATTPKGALASLLSPPSPGGLGRWGVLGPLGGKVPGTAIDPSMVGTTSAALDAILWYSMKACICACMA